MLSFFVAPMLVWGSIIPLVGEPLSMLAAASAAIAFDGSGPSSFKYNGVEFLQSGWCHVNYTEFTDEDGSKTSGDNSTVRRVDSGSGTVFESYPWGRVTYQFETAGARIHISVSIHNDSAKTLSSFGMALTTLKFPSKPAEYDGSTPVLGHNVGDPTALSMSYGSGALVLANEDVTQPLLVGFPWALDRPRSTVFPIQVNTGRNGMYPDSLPFIDRPIASGATLSFNLSLRFGSRGSTVETLASDIFRKFAAAFPHQLKWDDRRSIGMLILANSAGGYATNPRGWFNDSSIDVTTPSGIAAFQQRLLDYADGSIAILKAMNSQGMITWDIEGEQFPHAISYIGDPRIATTLAPELNGVVDQYFKKFRDAGLRVGLTLRPQRLVLSSDGESATQNEVSDPAQLLIDKISYARNHWGCTLFYIDSTGDMSDPVDAAFIERATGAFQDVLLMPENKNTRYYAYTAPYTELRAGFTSTPARVQRAYPAAFSLINTADGDLDAKRDALRAAVKRGDILLYRAWFNDPDNVKVKALYGAAAQR